MSRTANRIACCVVLAALVVGASVHDAEARRKKTTYVYLHDRQDGGGVHGFTMDRKGRFTPLPGSPWGLVDDGGTRVVKLAEGSEGLLVLGDRTWVGNTWHGSVSVVDSRTAAACGVWTSIRRAPALRPAPMTDPLCSGIWSRGSRWR